MHLCLDKILDNFVINLVIRLLRMLVYTSDRCILLTECRVLYIIRLLAFNQCEYS